MFFVVNVRVGRVNILLLYAFCARVQQSSAKANHLSANAKPRKNNTAGKAIDIPSVVGTIAKSRLYQEIFVLSLVDSSACQQFSVVKVEPQAKLSHDVVSETAAPEILHADGKPVYIVV